MKGIIRRLIDAVVMWFFFLFRPSFWMMNYPFDESWDQEFTKLLSNYRFTDIDYYYATLGERRIWIANYPHASFTLPTRKLSPFEDNTQVRPSRWTIYKARQNLKRDFYTQHRA